MDQSKVKIGDIVVTDFATPSHLPALYKAGALVVNEGGFTSHAAFYAKALRIPALIDTEIATQVLKTGDRVKLDANKGIVKKI